MSSTPWNIDLPQTQYFDRNSNADDLQALVNEMKAQPEIAIDTETTGLVSWKDIPLYWSAAWEGKRVTLRSDTLPLFQELWADETKWWVMANAKYDTHILANVGINLRGKLVDTQVMHALLYEEKPHGLKFMAQHILNWSWADFQDTFGKIGKKQSAEDMIRKAERENMNLLIEYASNDACGTYQVFKKLREQLKAALTFSLFRDTHPYIDTLWDLFHKVEVPYTKVLWKMERHGIKVDRERFEKAGPEAEAEILDVHKQINAWAGKVLNVNSPMDLRWFFFDKLGLKPLKMTSGGKSGKRMPSTDEATLEILATQHPAAELVQKHRKLSKLFGTYIKGLHALLDPNDRIHTRYNQDVARTGRLSSSEPNLQNIPRPENDRWNLRSAFIAEPGYDIIAVDYEQLEMRLLAAAALEPRMIQIFADGKDIHTGNVEMVFGIPYEDVVNAKKIEKKVKAKELPESEMTDYVKKCIHLRAAIKSVGFGLNYGMGPARLAGQVGISLDEAKKLIEQYMAAYPAVQKFFDEAVKETEQSGYAFTILGRRRNVPEIRSYQRNEQAQGRRIALNTQIQGSAADAAKMAQINLDKVNIEGRYGCRQLLQVHDEIVFECPHDVVDEVMPEIIDLMEHPFSQDLAVHLAVDHGRGTSWGQAK